MVVVTDVVDIGNTVYINFNLLNFDFIFVVLIGLVNVETKGRSKVFRIQVLYSFKGCLNGTLISRLLHEIFEGRLVSIMLIFLLQYEFTNSFHIIFFMDPATSLRILRISRHGYHDFW